MISPRLIVTLSMIAWFFGSGSLIAASSFEEDHYTFGYDRGYRSGWCDGANETEGTTHFTTCEASRAPSPSASEAEFFPKMLWITGFASTGASVVLMVGPWMQIRRPEEVMDESEGEDP